MRQVVPVFTRFVQMPFASNLTLPQSKPLPNINPKQAFKNMYFDNEFENGFGLCWRSMGPGTIAGKGEIISVGARLDAS